MDDSKCYHEFCRLLARLKCNYQLSELIKLDYYSDLIQLIAKFTIASLRVNITFNSIQNLIQILKYFLCFKDVAVLSQLAVLLAKLMATNGGITALHQSPGATFA